ncbi:MAG TPA: CdaR family protein [Candidatus Dormibacteraeota bacterium]
MNLPVPAIIRRNFRLKAMAVVLALVVWSVVVYANNPPDSRSFVVPVQFDGRGTMWAIDQPIDPITVHITGTREHVGAFTRDKLSARVDVSRITHAGTQDVPVVVLNNDPDVNTDGPATVRAYIDVLATRTVPVTPVTIKGPPAGFRPEVPTVTPGSVLVNGAKRLIDQVRAQVEVDLTGFKTNYSQELTVRLIDPAGTVVTNLGVTPTTVLVEVLINSTFTSRSVPIIVVTQGQPASGHLLASLTPVPQTVVLTGPATVLQTIDFLNVQVNIFGLFGSVTVSGIPVSTPVGVTASPNKVDVHVGVLIAPPPPTAAPTAAPAPSPSPTPVPTP